MRKRLMKHMKNAISKLAKMFRITISKILQQEPQKKQDDEVDVKTTDRPSREFDDHYYKTLHKKEQILEKLVKSLEKKRELIQCDCLHTTDDGFNVRMIKKENGEIAFECRNCKKRINASRVPENRIDQSINAIDMMCDMIKMNLDVQTKKDADIADWISLVQYHTRCHMKQLYAATQRPRKEKKIIDTDIYGKTYIRKEAD